jgi:hypothetical protein
MGDGLAYADIVEGGDAGVERDELRRAEWVMLVDDGRRIVLA